MTDDRRAKILEWLAAKRYRHVERFCTGICNTWVTPEEMKELVDAGLAKVMRPWYAPDWGYSSTPCRFYITDKGRALT